MAWFSEGYEKVTEEAKRVEDLISREYLPTFFLRDGEEATVTFLTENPFNYYQHYVPSLKRSFTCSQDDSCPLCAIGNKASFKGAYLVIDHRVDKWEDREGKKHQKQYQVKVLSLSLTHLQVLQKKHQRKGLGNHDWLITRTGSGQNTAYDFEAVDKVDVPKPESLPDLKEVLKPYDRQYLLQKLAEVGIGTPVNTSISLDDEDEGVIDFNS